MRINLSDMLMKKNVVFVWLLLILLGVSTVLTAQNAPKKKKKKKKKQTTEQSAAAVDTTPKQPVVMAAPPPDAAPADSGHTDGLVADTTQDLSFLNYKLDTTRPVDGMYKIPLLRGAKPFPIAKQNKYNIKFYKRIWRQVDLTDSINRIFSVPGETLMALVLDAIKAGKLIAYKDEGFRSRLSYETVMKAFSDSNIVPVIDSLTGEQTGTRTVFNPFNPDSILKFEIKEDIYFDKIRGRMITQTVGLAPIKRIKLSTGEIFGEDHPFWLYFDQCRQPFAGKEIFDTQRDIYNVSYDDIFMTRNFATTIVKESNPGDLRIKDKYADDAAQKKEAARIEQEIRDYKKNLWKY
jgi:gliding motility associated protien GldN